VEPTPLRPNGEVGLEIVLGGEPYRLPVLSMRLNREWQQTFAHGLTTLVDGIGQPKTFEEVATAVAGQSEMLMDMLIAYDHSRVLPDRDWIDSHATDREVYEAIQKVADVASPLGSNLLGLALMQAAQKVRSSLRSSSGPAPSTGGRRRRSKAA
jgi:hypothetical protein